MLNHNHQNSGCDFSTDLVSYLYGEINQKEKSRFEAHLANCTACPIELAEFAAVQSAFGDWRQEFAQMPTPVIVIPYENAVFEKPFVSGDSESWRARIRRAFSFSPMWSAATAALAILIVCGSLFLFVKNVSQPEDIAEFSVSNNENISASPKPETNVDSVTEINLAQKELQTEKITSEQATKSPKILFDENVDIIESEAAAKRISTKTVVKVNDSPKNTKQTKKSSAAAQKDKIFNQPVPNNIKAPTLNNYEEIEDETLRLADLFAEVDTRN